jgi:hypothetical protein
MDTQQPDVCDSCGVVEFAVSSEHIRVEVTSLAGAKIQGRIRTPECWRACPECTRLINAEDERGLLERSDLTALEFAGTLSMLDRTQRRRFMRERKRGLVQLHRGFWQGLDDSGGPEDDDPRAA